MYTRNVLGGMAAVGVLAGLGAGAHALEARAGHQLDAAMVTHAAALLPGGRVDAAHVTDDPALLAGLRGRLQQTVVEGRTADGHRVRVIVRGYDREARHARSVSWEIAGLPLTDGWREVPSGSGASSERVAATVDGHRVEAGPVARLDGRTLSVHADQVTVDGVGVDAADAPALVRGPLVAADVGVPAPAAGGTAERAWMDGGAVGVAVSAQDVGVGGAR